MWNANHRPNHVKLDILETLHELKLDYLDSYVMHWPMAVPSTGKDVALRKHGCGPAHYTEG